MLTRTGDTQAIFDAEAVVAFETSIAWVRAGEVSLTELAVRGGVTRACIARVVRLAFLSPQVAAAILAGKQRAGLTVATFTVECAVPPSLREQEKVMLLARAVQDPKSYVG